MHRRALIPAAAPRNSTSNGGNSGSQRLEPTLEEEEAGDEGEDGFLDEEGEFEEEEAEDVVGELGLGEDDAAPGISTGGTAWGEAGVQAAHKVRGRHMCRAGCVAHVIDVTADA